MKDSVTVDRGCCAETHGTGGLDIADHDRRLSTKEPTPKSGQLQRVQSALALIENTLQGDLNLRRLAQDVHQGRSHSARAFKRTTGFTLHAYVAERRLGAAIRPTADARKSAA